ncbi:MAG: flagellar biosynthesis protein FlhB [Gammaproteobacteria bacterium]|nr:MAG: flagellar biosynthesis protein FlhB [Gammaproteobacteria bacterium]
MAGEKTEQPTARRLRKFREEGRVAKSQELGGMLVLFAGVYMFTVTGPRLANSVAHVMQRSYTTVARIHGDSFTFVFLRQLANQAALEVGLAMIPWILSLLVIGVGVNVVQTRGLVQPRLLIPKWDRLNPLNRVRQIFGKQLLVETAKGIAKQSLIAVIVYLTVKGKVAGLIMAAQQGLLPGVQMLTSIIFVMSLQAAGVLLLIGIFDYLWQYRQHRQSLMMTKQEVKDETRQQEGSPEVKTRIRRIQREMAQRRMMAQVPTADAVIVNPTHYAVAIKYDGTSMHAPQIVAKGQDDVALKIISVARRHGVPVVPNRPLARALVKLPLNSFIPPEFFQAVAEVLAFVYRLQSPANQAAG